MRAFTERQAERAVFALAHEFGLTYDEVMEVHVRYQTGRALDVDAHPACFLLRAVLPELAGLLNPTGSLWSSECNAMLDRAVACAARRLVE